MWFVARSAQWQRRPSTRCGGRRRAPQLLRLTGSCHARLKCIPRSRVPCAPSVSGARVRRASGGACECGATTTTFLPVSLSVINKRRLICGNTVLPWEMDGRRVGGPECALEQGPVGRLGIRVQDIFDEVHRSNMTKSAGVVNERGKAEKHERFVPPQLNDII